MPSTDTHPAPFRNDTERWERLRSARFIARREGLPSAKKYLRMCGFPVADGAPLILKVFGREMRYIAYLPGNEHKETVCLENGEAFISTPQIWQAQAGPEKLDEDSVISCVNCGAFVAFIGHDWKRIRCHNCGATAAEGSINES